MIRDLGQDMPLRDLIRAHGRGCNSFFALYSGFREFRCRARSGREAVIAYVEAGSTWVGAGDPLCDVEDLQDALREFAQAARAQGRSTLLLPADGRTREAAHASGYGSVMIGTEAVIEHGARREGIALLPTARQLANRGATVEEFKPDDLPSGVRTELDWIVRKWLTSRKTTPLSFLNTVDPWAHSADKKYFKVTQRGRVLAFVAAMPIWARKSWYLVDLMRSDDAPPGSTELLVLEATRQLVAQGARGVSLGVSPLSNLGLAPDRGRAIYRLLSFMYERGNLLYNFKPLFQFKQKFEPSSWEPVYLLMNPPRLSPGMLSGLSTAFLPRGLLHASVSGFARTFIRFELDSVIRKVLQPVVVPRSPPTSLPRLLSRLPLTFSLIAACIAIHLMARGYPDVVASLAFSGETVTRIKVKATLIHPFLHWSTTHLASNMALTLFFGGLLEYIAGTRRMLACWMTGALTSNFVTLLLLLSLAWLAPEIWSKVFVELDVGASLGLFACAGALVPLIRKGWIIPFALGAISVGFSIATHSLLALDHVVALGLGWLVSRKQWS